jgi:hypothetical protein
MNPYNHSSKDTYQQINPAYLGAQIQTSVAFAGDLSHVIPYKKPIRI